MRSVSPATRNQSVPCVSHVWSSQNSLVNIERSSCGTSTRAMSCKYCNLAFIGNVLILLFVIARAEQSTREQRVERIQGKEQVQSVVPERRVSGTLINPHRRNFINGRHFGRSSGFVDVSNTRSGNDVNEEKLAKDFEWLSALSKFAKVRLADETFRNSRVAGRESESMFGRTISIGKDQEVTQNPRSKEVIHEDHKIQESNSMEKSKMEFKPKKFHCHPIQDIYIRTVDRKMPAYICKLGERAFILSSERFLQDHRDHLDVDVDESTFHRLVPNPMALKDSQADVIPATLIRKPGEDSYGIRKSERILKDKEMSNSQ